MTNANQTTGYLNGRPSILPAAIESRFKRSSLEEAEATLVGVMPETQVALLSWLLRYRTLSSGDVESLSALYQVASQAGNVAIRERVRKHLAHHMTAREIGQALKDMRVDGAT